MPFLIITKLTAFGISTITVFFQSFISLVSTASICLQTIVNCMHPSSHGRNKTYHVISFMNMRIFLSHTHTHMHTNSLSHTHTHTHSFTQSYQMCKGVESCPGAPLTIQMPSDPRTAKEPTT